MPDDPSTPIPNEIPIATETVVIPTTPDAPPPHPPTPPPVETPSATETEPSKPNASPIEPPIKPIISPAQKNAEKKPPRLLIGSVILFLFLASIPVAMYLLNQRQEVRKQAADICNNPGDSCTDNYTLNCTTDTGQAGTRSCHKQGTCTGVGGGDQCSWGDGSFCDTCVASNQPQRCPNGDNGQQGQECGNLANCDIAGGCNPDCCASTGDCSSGKTCEDVNGYCRSGLSCRAGSAVTPTPSGSCAPIKSYSGASSPGTDCGQGGNASVTVKATIPAGCPLDGASVTYTKTDASCPGLIDCSGTCGTAPTTETLNIPAGSQENSATVSCGPPGSCGTCQVDIDDYGVRRWESSGCSGPQPTPVASCQAIKAYNTSWTLLNATALANLKAGDTVRFTSLGQTNSGSFTKARFTVNGTLLPETTNKKPGTEEFYTEYVVPAGTTSFMVTSEVFHATLGWR